VDDGRQLKAGQEASLAGKKCSLAPPPYSRRGKNWPVAVKKANKVKEKTVWQKNCLLTRLYISAVQNSFLKICFHCFLQIFSSGFFFEGLCVVIKNIYIYISKLTLSNT
jgi:hypothetical protein